MKTSIEEDTRTLRHLFEDVESAFQLVGSKDRQALLNKLLEFVDAAECTPSPTNNGFNHHAAEATRKRAGFTRAKLSEIIDIHPITIYKMEKGRLPYDPTKPKHKGYMEWLVMYRYE